MAKIYDALKKAGFRPLRMKARNETKAQVKLLRDEDSLETAAEPMVVDLEEKSLRLHETNDEDSAGFADADELFFIEVGGRDEPIEGSPAVMQCSVPRRSAPAAMPQQPAEKEDLAIVFQPWPGPNETDLALTIGPELVTFHEPASAASGKYFKLLDQLAPAAANSTAILFTAPGRSTGVTTVLLNLAFAAAHDQNRRIVALDMNWQAPAMAERLGLANVPGLQEACAGAVSLEAALKATPRESLFLLTQGNHASEAPLAPEGLAWIINCLRARFDLIFIDAPAWEEKMEVERLVPLADLVCPVAERSIETTKIAHFVQQLRTAGGTVRGVISKDRS